MKHNLLTKLLVLFACAGFVGNGWGQTSYTVIFGTPGTNTWTIPLGVTSISVTCIGGGGAGGGAGTGNSSGGGGGGGASVTQTYSVAAGQALTMFVGSGGTGVSAGSGNPGTASYATYNSTTFISAAPGAGGIKAASGAGGAGGAIANNIPVNAGFKGGNGGNGSAGTASANNNSGSGGGGAGTTAAGGNAGNSSTAGVGTAGIAGATYGRVGATGISTSGNTGGAGISATATTSTFGGGGSGATVYSGASQAGGNGGNGGIIITYTVPATVTIVTLTSGTSWVVPANVCSLSVECWGGGGGGGGVNKTISASAGGGGGGGYSLNQSVTVTPGSTVSYSIGAAGTAGPNTGGAGGAGGTTSFGSPVLVSAGGGGGGGGSTSGTVPGSGGTAGTGTTFNGGAGAAGVSGTRSGGGGASAGIGANGIAASGLSGGFAYSPFGGGGANGVSSLSNGNAGTTPGGGGSGAMATSSVANFTGGAGGSGKIILMYIACPITCSAPTSVTLSATNTTYCPSGSTLFSTSISGGSLGGGSWEYQFELTDGTVLQAWSTTSTFTPSTFNASISIYNVVVKVRSSACTSLSTTSNTVVITVNSISTVPSSVSGSTSVCSGTSTTLFSNGGTLGYEAQDLWYSGSCPTDYFSQEWATQPYLSFYNTTVNSVSNGILNVTSTGTDPMIEMYGLGSFTPTSARYINIRYRVTSVAAAGYCEIFFTNSTYTVATGIQDYTNGALISDGQWHVLSIDMPTSNTANNGGTNYYNSGGNITGWRFDWATANLVTMDIDFITLSSSPIIETGSTLTVSPSSTTTYYTLKKGGCNTTTCASTTVTVSASPTTSNAGSAQSLCVGSSVTLAANNPSSGTGSWSITSGPNTSTSQFSSTSAYNSTFTPTANGTYVLTWTITLGSCSSTSTVTITVNGAVINPITGTTSISCGGTTTLSTSLSGSYGATGGTITTSGGYTIHTFTSSGNLVVPAGFSASADYLIVAGGGGGGASDNYYAGGAGGGGAGGMLSGTTTLSAQTYPIVVGIGGAGGTGGASSVTSQGTRGTNGSNSTFNSVSATGGGGGGAPTNKPGLTGGSGGGAYYSASGGTGTAGQGNNGGLNTSSNGSSGGGGAGAVGGSTNYSNAGGVGGIGLQSSITGTATYYAGGGGGGGYSSSAGGAGGNGGGGTAPNSPGVGGAGTNGLGGGGAGASGTGNYNGGRGGDGVVIIRYLTPSGTWSSSNTSVATVNSSTGVVTAVSDGTSTITYSFTYNGCTSTVSTIVTVSGCASITTGSVTGPLCEGSSISVPYTATGTFNSGNVFTAQLSNASGSFASPTTIGTLTSTASGTIAATLPTGISGSGYLIRVISSNPAITGSSTAAFTIVASPTTATVSVATLSVCGSLTSGSLGGNTAIIGTGTWTYVSGVTGSFSNASSPTSTFTASGYGTSVLRWTISNSPCASSTADVTVTFTPNIDFANTNFPTSATICIGGSQTIYGKIYINSVTVNAGATAGLVAELGYSTSNSNPSGAGWTWVTASYNAQVANDDEYVATLTGLAAGTYYYAYRFSYNGCTYTYGGTGGIWSSTANNGILAVYDLPSVTMNPSSICNGATSVSVSASGASTYELLVNGTSQGMASSTSSWTVAGPLSTGNTVCVRGYPTNDLVMNGDISEAFWGTNISNSGSGPGSGFGNNRINALYVRNGFGYLNLAVAGRLENDNKILLFLDTKSGGYNSLSTWSNRSNAPNNGLKNLNGGMQFDSGFDPDYVVSIGVDGGGISYLDFYDMANNSSTYIGSSSANPNLISYQTNTSATDYTKGYEIRIPINLIGSIASPLKLFGMLTNNPNAVTGTYLSNQFFSPAGSSQGNFTDIAVNFNNEPPNPVYYTLNSDCYTDVCRTVAANVTPTFNQVAAICTGGSLTALPTTSTNGISGTWSPALNNSITTTYTFTPSSGTCVGTATMTITVNTPPNIDAISPP